ncbi:Uncharacterised protein [Providencia rettgeri]|uniref:Uncharacterized protein n=1 Tax=Providencia rettgeri TaxID=587 RepID=A0A379LQ54_PRORE|nr:Uncharacterised protein [Providencia rettgeri]
MSTLETIINPKQRKAKKRHKIGSCIQSGD